MIAVAMQIKIDMTASCLRLIIIDLNKDCVKLYLLSLRYEKRVFFKTQGAQVLCYEKLSDILQHTNPMI